MLALGLGEDESWSLRDPPRLLKNDFQLWKLSFRCTGRTASGSAKGSAEEVEPLGPPPPPPAGTAAPGAGAKLLVARRADGAGMTVATMGVAAPSSPFRLLSLFRLQNRRRARARPSSATRENLLALCNSAHVVLMPTHKAE